MTTTTILSKRTLSLTQAARKAVALAPKGEAGFVAQVVGVAHSAATLVSDKTGESYSQLNGIFRAKYYDGTVEESQALPGLKIITSGAYSAIADGAISVEINARLYAVESSTSPAGYEWRVESRGEATISLPSFDADLPMLAAPKAKTK